jgi:predicted TIM-barrel fold metal-dependent hydrolase
VRWSTGCSATRRSLAEQNRFYYDAPQYLPFWAAVEQLDAPFYLHPRNPIPAWSQIYAGHPWLLGPTWAFAQEAAVHALRLMGSGLFDRHPRLNIVLGHLGENLPYSLWRIDNRNNWAESAHRRPAQKTMADYFPEQFPSHPQSIIRSKAALMAPPGSTLHQSARRIGCTNARKLFRLDS